jgi:hypothetical protein
VILRNNGKNLLERLPYLKDASNYFPDLEFRGRLNMAKYLDAISQNGGEHSSEVRPFLEVALQLFPICRILNKTESAKIVGCGSSK